MNIIGPDALVFGVDDVAACSRYLTDYGLTPVGNGRFEYRVETDHGQETDKKSREP